MSASQDVSALSSTGDTNSKEPQEAGPATSTGSPADVLSSSAPAPSEPPLPPLTPREFKEYNRLAEKMSYFHDHFKSEYAVLYSAASNGRRPSGMSMREFLRTATSLCEYLELHHNIEETYLFPKLARKQPQFSSNGRHAEEHKLMHDGLKELQAYANRCLSGEEELRLSELRDILDRLGSVLLPHMDEEVASLSAESMRKCWTLNEMRCFGM